MGVMGDFKEGIRSEGEMPGEHWAWLGMPGRGVVGGGERGQWINHKNPVWNTGDRLVRNTSLLFLTIRVKIIKINTVTSQFKGQCSNELCTAVLHMPPI